MQWRSTRALLHTISMVMAALGSWKSARADLVHLRIDNGRMKAVGILVPAQDEGIPCRILTARHPFCPAWSPLGSGSCSRAEDHTATRTTAHDLGGHSTPVELSELPPRLSQENDWLLLRPGKKDICPSEPPLYRAHDSPGRLIRSESHGVLRSMTDKHEEMIFPAEIRLITPTHLYLRFPSGGAPSSGASGSPFLLGGNYVVGFLHTICSSGEADRADRCYSVLRYDVFHKDAQKLLGITEEIPSHPKIKESVTVCDKEEAELPSADITIEVVGLREPGSYSEAHLKLRGLGEPGAAQSKWYRLGQSRKTHFGGRTLDITPSRISGSSPCIEVLFEEH